MYNQPFFIPRYYGLQNMMRSSMIPATNTIARTSLFGRLGNVLEGIKSFNWSNLINNTSKTLGIINQTIPLVRQVGPMVGNMKSMIKLASVFKDETDTSPNQNLNNNINNNEQKEKESQINNNFNSDSPTFFIN